MRRSAFGKRHQYPEACRPCVPQCDNIFSSRGVFAPQQRKIKPPAQFTVAESDVDRLDMAFRWSLRTEPPISVFALFAILFGTIATFTGMLAEGAPGELTLLPLIPLLWVVYVLLTLLVNRTHYRADGETLHVYTEPLPYFRYGKKALALDEIREVTVERPAYAPFPEGKAGFYNVYAHTLDGDKIQIAAYVNYEHAHFIAQELKAYLDAPPEASEHLSEKEETHHADAGEDWENAASGRLKA